MLFLLVISWSLYVNNMYYHVQDPEEIEDEDGHQEICFEQYILNLKFFSPILNVMIHLMPASYFACIQKKHFFAQWIVPLRTSLPA